jgi:hypothetical protein
MPGSSTKWITNRFEMFGAVITEIVPGSPASRCKQLYPGVVVIGVNNNRVGETTYSDLLAQFQQPLPLQLTFHDPFAVDPSSAAAAKLRTTSTC